MGFLVGNTAAVVFPSFPQIVQSLAGEALQHFHMKYFNLYPTQPLQKDAVFKVSGHSLVQLCCCCCCQHSGYVPSAFHLSLLSWLLCSCGSHIELMSWLCSVAACVLFAIVVDVFVPAAVIILNHSCAKIRYLSQGKLLCICCSRLCRMKYK